MRYAFAPIALAALAAANPVPQGVYEDITPETSAPAGCSPDYPGTFQIQVVNTTSTKRSLDKRQSGALILTLQGGILKDDVGRIGYIAANRQFQFDGPVQTGAIYTAGWSACPNGTLALGSDTVFEQCLSGTFYNLYDESDAAQCNSVYVEILGAPTGGASSGSDDDDDDDTAGAPVTQIADGQPQASTAAVSQIADGQIQAPVTQIADGQIQAPTGSPVTQIADGQIQAPTGSPVTQIADGQIQAPTGAPVTQIADGQIQAPTGAPVTQIADGQIQAPTGAPVTQIADGQIQAPTGSPVTQIADGQIQAPTGAPVTQIADGQIQAPTNGSSYASPTVQAYTGAAAMATAQAGFLGLAAGALAMAML